MRVEQKWPQIRPGPVVIALGLLVVLGVAVALRRYAFGIGAISNLNDYYPWGFWISFDLLCGVALGAGAFTMAATVYILDLKQFRPLLRPSILTGFLGYVMVIIALLVDLGRPERIWHMMIYMNGESVLLEIGLCVMTYTTVLLLEFAPVVLGGWKWARPVVRGIHAVTMPLVILGVVLSTLHQSSLGSLFLILPERLHPLWYTPILPVLFFVSAVGVGLAMVIFESSLSSRAFHRGLELHLLERVAKVVPFVAGLYLVLRFGTLAVEGKLGLLFAGDMFSLLFWLEVLVGWVVPLVLFSLPAVRRSPRGLLAGALAGILGLMLNRFDVSWLAIARPAGASYSPNWMELAVSFGIISGGVLAFAVIARFFPLFEEEGHGAHAAPAQPPAIAERSAHSA